MTNPENQGWFVAQLRPHGLAQARKHLLRQGFETFSPDVLVNSSRGARRGPARKPLFPGYIFVSFDPAQNGWTAINHTRGVSRLILSDPRRPQAMPANLMAGLMARCDSTELVTTADDLNVGDRIRVLSGPFTDLVTRIETLTDAERVGVLIELMGRQVRMSLPRSQVSKLA